VAVQVGQLVRLTAGPAREAGGWRRLLASPRLDRRAHSLEQRIPGQSAYRGIRQESQQFDDDGPAHSYGERPSPGPQPGPQRRHNEHERHEQKRVAAMLADDLAGTEKNLAEAIQKRWVTRTRAPSVCQSPLCVRTLKIASTTATGAKATHTMVASTITGGNVLLPVP